MKYKNLLDYYNRNKYRIRISINIYIYIRMNKDKICNDLRRNVHVDVDSLFAGPAWKKRRALCQAISAKYHNFGYLIYSKYILFSYYIRYYSHRWNWNFCFLTFVNFRALPSHIKYSASRTLDRLRKIKISRTYCRLVLWTLNEYNFYINC